MNVKLAKMIGLVAAVCALPSVLSATETVAVDLDAVLAPLSTNRMSGIARETGDGGNFWRFPSATFPLEIREPGPHAVWVKFWTPSNACANLQVRIMTPDQECLRFGRFDFVHHLPYWKPAEFAKHPERPAQTHIERMDINFEFTGTYSVVVAELPSTYRQPGDNCRHLACIYASNDPAFDPRKGGAPASAASGATSAPVLRGFEPARVHPLTADLNSGIADWRKRYRANMIQNYPIFWDPAALINYGCTFEQGIRPFAAQFKLPGSGGVELGPNTRELEREYPMPKRGDTNTVPVGRFANADGRYSNDFSYNFEPAIRAAYAANVAKMKALLTNTVDNAWVDSFYLAGEQGGRYDYGETSVAAYRKFLARKYRDLAALNAAWHTSYPSFDAITPARRADCVGDFALTNMLERARATANFIDFRDFCSKSYAEFLARGRVKALNDADPQHRPVAAQFANLDLSAVRWADWRPLDFEDIMRIALKDATQFCYDVYATDDFVGLEYDLFSALGLDRLNLVVREGGIHSTDAGMAARTYWTLLSKGLKGFSLFMLQEGNGHPEFPKFGLTNVDQSPRPKAAAFSDIMRAVEQVEPLVAGGRRRLAVKPVGIYYSKTVNALQPCPYGSIFDSAPDSPFRVYELMRANGYPVTFVTDRQILEGDRLDQVAAVFFVDAKYIPDAVLDKVEAWVDRGGNIFADAQPGVFNGHGFPSDRLMKFLEIAPHHRKAVDRMKIDLNGFGYNSDAFDLINSERTYESTFEYFQQTGSLNPINQRLGGFMFSGFGHNSIDALGGEVVIMAQDGRPAGVMSRHGKGTAFYFAGNLGSIYGGAATQYEWRDGHAGDSPFRFMDAYLASVGARKSAEVSGIRPRLAYRLRVESPIVDDRGNAFLGIASYNDGDLPPCSVSWRWPDGLRAPKSVYFMKNGTRRIEPLAFAQTNGVLTCRLPGFMTHAAVLALAQSEPLVSVESIADAERGEAELAVLRPGRVYDVSVRVYNPSDRKLKKGRVTLRLPHGWFYDHESVEVGTIPARGASDVVTFRVRTPDCCGVTRVRPLSFIFEAAGGVKSMPTAEVVWWKPEEE